jgi:hypothetical protein
VKKPEKQQNQSGGKQATLFGMKKGMPPPKAVTRDSMVSTETERDEEEETLEETQTDDRPARILQESQVSLA